MIDRIKQEIKCDNLKIVATGGLSSLIIPLCKHEIILDKDLVLEGLLQIYKKNIK
jgi:type III pantothenate kinase